MSCSQQLVLFRTVRPAHQAAMSGRGLASPLASDQPRHGLTELEESPVDIAEIGIPNLGERIQRHPRGCAALGVRVVAVTGSDDDGAPGLELDVPVDTGFHADAELTALELSCIGVVLERIGKFGFGLAWGKPQREYVIILCGRRALQELVLGWWELRDRCCCRCRWSASVAFPCITPDIVSRKRFVSSFVCFLLRGSRRATGGEARRARGVTQMASIEAKETVWAYNTGSVLETGPSSAGG